MNRMPGQSGDSIGSLTQAQECAKLSRFKWIRSNSEHLEIPLQMELCQSHACLFNRTPSNNTEEYEQPYDNLEGKLHQKKSLILRIIKTNVSSKEIPVYWNGWNNSKKRMVPNVLFVCGYTI